MRIGIQGWGSEGDLRPLVALAARLRREGHAPRLVLTPIDGKDYAPLCRALGVPLSVVPEHVPVTVQQLVRDAKSANPMKLMAAVLELTFFPHLEAMYAAALDLCAASDVVVGGSAAWVVKAAALHAGVPFAAVHYYPGVVASRHVPPPILPAWSWLNRPGWALVGLMMDMGFRGPAAKFFAQKGLPPVRHAIPDALFSDRLNLHAASPSFWPPPPDWGPLHFVCGELSLPEEAEGWQPSPALAAFLAGGPPPVLLTLGSMEHMAPARARDLLVRSARHAGVRAIVQTKTSDDEGCDGDLYFLPWAPHRALAPRCAAVVHHGGAGTTHAALRAGKASVVLPFIFEQRLWGNRLRAVGAAGAPLSFWKATPEKVAARIREVMEVEALGERAAGMGRAMAAEDGAGAAVEALVGLG
jgi:sterol 3beta-glucosyltransferase